jgi:hypothetical protein
MLPLYAARIEDLGQGGFVNVDCSGCEHATLLAPDFLLSLELDPPTKARSQRAGPVRALRKEGTTRDFDQVAAAKRMRLSTKGADEARPCPHPRE